jgi:SAM-dependent methyltransferase
MIIRLTPFEHVLRRAHLLPLPVVDAFGGVLFGRALAIAVRRGLFEALSAGPLNAPALAERTGLHPEAVALVAGAAAEAGYLTSHNGLFTLSTEGRKWLLKDSPNSLVFLIRYFETLHARWGDLERAMDRGKPARIYYEGFSDEDWRVYVLAMRDLARLVIPLVMRKVRIGKGASLLLDLGGSHGLYAAACCRKSPGLSAVVMDFEPAARVGQEVIREEGLEERVRFLPGDILRSPLPSHTDAILLFNIIHGFDEQQNRALIARALEALRPGGLLFILDQLKDGGGRSGVGRFVPLMVGLNLLSESGGTAYEYPQIKEWCHAASRVSQHSLRLPGLSLIEAVR